ncbi:SGNH/GDSL hydrolase family protein [Pontimicrobium aquaticum]|uniref:SGNH/GDSL hydrolase family protein n=1 Tax=Pontimicrobium aquaticum TaxID=2565367 RepID=A0A4U0F027_9FLAO|nr:hypothetical protein [Pontimicrobium aquaticum]TJY37751.1 hypothetical protein E5167_00425 [Pontimicrobium aquaticum]
MVKTIVRFICVVCFVNTANLSAQQSKTIKVLFVGNSYTARENIPQTVSTIGTYAGSTIEVALSTAEGASLDDHWHQKRGLKTRTLILENKYDYVILQDQSMRPIDNPDGLIRDIKWFSKYTTRHDSKLGLFVTWAKNKSHYNQQVQIINAYVKASKESGGFLIPVGNKWQIAKEKYPDIELYDKDGSHPSKIGGILSSLIIASSIIDDFNNKDLKAIIENCFVELTDYEKEFLFEIIRFK